MPNSFKVCVHCFTFNHAQYITDALDGFSMQKTDFPFVCVILDDCSTDANVEILSDYVNRNFNIIGEEFCENNDDYKMSYARHISNENCYFAVYYLKYNHYTAKRPKTPYFDRWDVRSKYLALCEGDDYWIDPGKLQMQVSFLEKNPNYSLVHTRFDYYYVKSGQTKRETKSHKFISTRLKKDQLIGYYILDNNQYRIQTATVMYSRQKYDEIRMFEVEEKGLFMMGDTQLWMNLLSVGKFHYLPNITAVYRIMEESATRSAIVEKRIRFALSAAEMRYYYACKYKLNIGHFRRMYLKYLRMYLLFNKDYVTNPAIISYSLDPLTLSLKSSKVLSLIGKKMLELYYSYR